MKKTRVAMLSVLLCLIVVIVGCAGGVGWLLPLLVGQAAQSDRLVISPASPTVPPAAKVNFNVKAYSLLGNPVPITGLQSWSCDANVGGIGSSSGAFTAISSASSVQTGMVRVTVRGLTGSGTSASTLVTVDPAAAATLVALSLFPESLTLAQGQQMRFVAVPTNTSGAFVSDTDLLWTTSDPSAGTIDSTGLFTAATSDTAEDQTCNVRVIAGKDGVQLERTVEVTVKPPTSLGAIAALVLSPANVTVCAGADLRFVVVGADENGNFVPVTGATWSVTGSIGTVSSAGVLTAGSILATGTVTVTSGSVQSVAATVQVVAAS